MSSELVQAVGRLRGITYEVRAPARNSRAPLGATYSPGVWQQPGYPQPEQFDPQASIENAYFAELYSYRCVNSIATNIARLVLRAGADPTTAKNHNPAAPLAKLLSTATQGSPNPMWSPFQLLRYSLAQYVLCGKTAWLKEFGPDGRTVIGLWPLGIQHLKPVPDLSNNARYFAGFQYGQKGTPQYRELGADDVFYMYRPSLTDPRQAESVVQASQLNISIMRMLNAYDYTYLKNNATPSTMIVTRPFAEPEEKRAFQDQFVAEFGGYSNAGKTIFLEAEEEEYGTTSGGSSSGMQGAFSVARIGATAKESELSDQRAQKIQDICVAWGVPLSVLGDSSNAKFQNSPVDRKNYWLNTLDPTASEFADQINFHVAPQLGNELCWFDTSRVPELQNDAALTGVNAIDLVANHLFTRDEMRAMFGEYAPYDEVDPDHTPFGVQLGVDVATASKTDPIAKVYTDEAAEGGGDVGVAIAPVPHAKPVAAAKREDMLAARRARRAARQAGQPEARHAGPEGHQHVPTGHATMPVIKRMLNTAMTQLIADQKNEAAKRLSGQRGRKRQVESQRSVDGLFDTPYWHAKTVAILAPAYDDDTRAEQMATTLIQDTVDELRVAMLGREVSELLPAVTDVLGSSLQAHLARITADLKFEGAIDVTA